jgi:hypothetical protein
MGGSSSSSFRSCSTALVILQILVVMELWALIMAVAGVQGDAGSDYLAEKEKQVRKIVAQVELNDIQTCGMLNLATQLPTINLLCYHFKKKGKWHQRSLYPKVVNITSAHDLYSLHKICCCTFASDWVFKCLRESIPVLSM